MKKRTLALGLALTLTLSLTPAMAAGTADKFPTKNAWTGFTDVADNHWALAPIQICYETDLMKGKSAGFDPTGEVTVAEAMAVAARVGATLRGETIPASTDSTWYGGAVAYLKGLPGGDSISSMENLSEKNVSRWGFFRYLSIAVPENELAVKNSIISLPDAEDPALLRFYNAGILTGVNAYGTFVGDKGLSRAEMASMVSRIARPETAKSFTPETLDDPNLDIAAYYTGVASTATALTGAGYNITMLDFLTAYVGAVDDLIALCEKQGVPFSWDLSFTDGTSFPDDAMNTATINILRSLWAAEYGGGEYDAATALGARHILVETKAEADSIRAQLKAAGDTVAKFEELMKQLNGTAIETAFYTFGPGDMVSEFEAGTKALKIGQISEPVQSQFGWHIIQRAEPTAEDLTEMTYKDWLAEQNFQYSKMLLTIDFPAFYNNYTSDLK